MTNLESDRNYKVLYFSIIKIPIDTTTIHVLKARNWICCTNEEMCTEKRTMDSQFTKHCLFLA